MALEKEKKKVIRKPAATTNRSAKPAAKKAVAKKTVAKGSISLVEKNAALLDVNTEKLQFHLLYQNRLDQAYIEEISRYIHSAAKKIRRVEPHVLDEISGVQGQRILQKIASHNLLDGVDRPLSRNEVAKSVYAHFSEGTRGEKIDAILHALDCLQLVVYGKVQKLNKNNEKITVRYEIGATMALNRLLQSVFDRAERKLMLDEESLGEQ